MRLLQGIVDRHALKRADVHGEPSPLHVAQEQDDLANRLEGDGNVAIDAGPESFTVTDIDSTFLSSLTVRITAGANTGIDTLACPACDELGVTAAFSLTSNRLTLSGPASPADYQAALQSVTFGNASDTPTGADRVLTVIANDGSAASAPVTMTFEFMVTGDIVIIKDADPDNAQDFGYTENITDFPAVTGFSLDDDADSTLSNTRTFNNVVPGTYEVTELDVPGWDLTGLNCSDVDSTGDTLTGVATISVEQYETVTCTFYNDNLGTITVVDDTDPDDAQDFDFAHTITAVPAVAASFTLDDDADGTLSNEQIFENVAPGIYTVTETPESGWDLSNIVCTGGASTFTYGSGNGLTSPRATPTPRSRSPSAMMT